METLYRYPDIGPMFNIPKIAKKADINPPISTSPKKSLFLYQLKIISAIAIEKNPAIIHCVD